MKRLQSLDVMRGITVAGMILVNNPGSWSDVYAPLRHAEWNGLTPTDLVFPFFMFIMGMSTYLSLRKSGFALTWSTAGHVARRGVLIFAVGYLLAWFGNICFGVAYRDGESSWTAALVEVASDFDNVRVLGVLPRLGICYLVGALLALSVRRKALPWVIVSFLIVYAVVIVAGHGYEFSDRNVIAVVDRAVIGTARMYSDTVGGVRLHFDPEGLLSTLPSIAHMLIGFWAMGKIAEEPDNRRRATTLLLIGTVLTFAGLLLSYGLPINKKIWSPTYVLTTCGLASSLLGLLIWLIDVKGYHRWGRFFEVFGCNPLFLYVVSDVLAILLGVLTISVDGRHAALSTLAYEGLFGTVAPHAATASALFALLFVGLNWLIGLPLYRRKIYIKL